MVAAQYQADTEKSGFYAGEDQLGKTSTPKTKPLAKEITPEELLQEFVKSAPVSYTHLTLPTILLV